MDIDFDYVLRLGQFVFTVGVGLYSISAARGAKSKAEADNLTALETRVTVVEQRLVHLPGPELAAEMAELAGDMKAIKASLAGFADRLVPLTKSVDRITDYLMNNKK